MNKGKETSIKTIRYVPRWVKTQVGEKGESTGIRTEYTSRGTQSSMGEENDYSRDQLVPSEDTRAKPGPKGENDSERRNGYPPTQYEVDRKHLKGTKEEGIRSKREER